MDKIQDFEDKIAILRDVKSSLESMRSVYICFAIDDSMSNRRGFGRAKIELKKYVLEQLRPNNSLDGWTLRQTNNLPGRLQMRRNRIQWVEWMINQYEDQIIELKNVGEK